MEAAQLGLVIVEFRAEWTDGASRVEDSMRLI